MRKTWALVALAGCATACGLDRMVILPTAIPSSDDGAESASSDGGESGDQAGDLAGDVALLPGDPAGDRGPGDATTAGDRVTAGDTQTGDATLATYAWKTGTWGDCSASCDGTQSRAVWCERGDSVTVSDALCGGGKPIGSRGCSSCCPNCSGKNCGEDGCGGSCGSCSAGSCYSGHCAEHWTQEHDGSNFTCSEICFLGWGQECCGGTCLGDCNTAGQVMTCECLTYTPG